MAKTHFKQLVDPRYLGAYSLSQGQDIILTIREIRRETVTMMGGQKEECTIAYWMESEKPAILNVTNMKMIAKIYKTPYIEDWVGKKVQFYATTTRFGGETVECLRIRQFIPKQETALCGERIERRPGRLRNGKALWAQALRKMRGADQGADGKDGGKDGNGGNTGCMMSVC